jgi:hypothetical protein
LILVVVPKGKERKEEQKTRERQTCKEYNE